MAAFKTRKYENTKFNTPQEMYDDYKNRSIEGIHDYQSKLIEYYMEESVINKKDVALELPTGTGKTLIGLLIGEYRRRKFNEKVLYLCPTNQLVYQTVENAVNKFGIKAIPFTGSKYDYDSKSKGMYNSAEVIAVTNYSSLFNTDPYFTDADIIIFDDAHSGESYIASNWTVEISRRANKELYFDILKITKDILAEETYVKLVSENCSAYDFDWVDKVPNYNLFDKYVTIQYCIDSYIEKLSIENSKRPGIGYPWSNIRDNLHGCNLFLSYNEIIIRPFIPPTLTHAPFEKAKQRIYMSATLGKSGELERSFGINKIFKLPMVKDWENKTIGRKFFMFPDLSFKQNQRDEIILKILNIVDKAVMLVNDDDTKEKVISYIKLNSTGIKTFEAKSIEKTKQPFVDCKNGIAVMSNRFDGIDFPNDECRMLILFDLPTATHLQEKFLITCMASSVLFDERIKTRVSQALGRCTRSHSDFAAVCILGDDLMNTLLSPKNLTQYNPELQAEINFGKINSVDQDNMDEYLKLLDFFINKRNEWFESDGEAFIISDRDRIKKTITEGIQNESFKLLKKTAYYEVEAQYCIWKKDYENALVNIAEITSKLSLDPLKGYKGFWLYLQACCAYNIYTTSGNINYNRVFKDCLMQASKTTIAIKWFNNFKSIENRADDKSPNLMEYAIERIEANFQSKYDTLDKFYSKLSIIRDLLNSGKGDDFEKGHELLGTLLGYKSIKYNDKKYPGCPDPIWTIHEGLTIVSEDKIYENIDTPIPLNDVKQTASHNIWTKKYLDNPKINNSAKIIILFITNREKIDQSAKIHGENVYYLHVNEFIKWAEKCLETLKLVRMQFNNAGDIVWRENTVKIFVQNGITPIDFLKLVTKQKLTDL